MRDKIYNFLNKNLKEFNPTILIVSCIVFLGLVGLISYKVSSSYALFTDTVEGKKTITLHYEKQRLLYDVVADGAELDTNVDFSAAPTGHNKKFTFNSTKNDEYPVHYYRGEVDNNFVKFGGFCWRAVRTTSTGGTKLIYSGVPEEQFEIVNVPQSDYTIVTNSGWTFDSSDNSWNSEITENGGSNILDVSLPKGSYVVKMVGSSTATTGGGIYIIKDGASLYSYSISNADSFDKTYNLENTSDTDVIEFRFVGGGNMDNGPIVLKIQVQKSNSLGMGCPRIGSSTRLDSTSTIPNGSQAYIGYMYGTVYTDHFDEPIGGSKFGKSFNYNNGTYTLTDTVTTIDNTHHYTCNNTSGTCSTLRYYYYSNGGYNHYIKLTGGEGAQETLTKMQTNTSDGVIKRNIDSWYANNMVNYTNRLEDTPWCNDRSMQTTTNGWYENGRLNEFIYYGANGRVGTSYKSISPTYIPSLNCPNKNDAFSVNIKNGNGALTYPVALLTADEITMAGSVWSGYSNNPYLNTNQIWLSLSPSDFSCGENTSEDCNLFMFGVSSTGKLTVGATGYIRPSVSLKVGTMVKDGDGTYMNPMIVE